MSDDIICPIMSRPIGVSGFSTPPQYIKSQFVQIVCINQQCRAWDDNLAKSRDGNGCRMIPWNLSDVSTADLVLMLAGREGVMKLDLPDSEWKFDGKLSHPIERSCAQLDETGPATILVVRGEQE